LPGIGIERINAGLEKTSAAVQEGTSDKKITEQSTGTAEKTDAQGKPIKKTEDEYGGNDSIIVPFLDVRMEGGDSLVDIKVSKNTGWGFKRVSKPYFGKKIK
jgi:hypothetical protein